MKLSASLQLIVFAGLLVLAYFIPGWLHQVGFSVANAEQWGRLLFESPFSLKMVLLIFLQLMLGILLLHGIGHWKSPNGRLRTGAMALALVVVGVLAPVPDPSSLPESVFGFHAPKQESADTLARNWANAKLDTDVMTRLDSIVRITDSVPNFYFSETSSEYNSVYLLTEDLAGDRKLSYDIVLKIDTLRYGPPVYEVFLERQLAQGTQPEWARMRTPVYRHSYYTEQVHRNRDSSAVPIGDTSARWGYSMARPLITRTEFTTAEFRPFQRNATELGIEYIYREPRSGQLWVKYSVRDSIEYGYVRLAEGADTVARDHNWASRLQAPVDSLTANIELFPLTFKTRRERSVITQLKEKNTINPGPPGDPSRWRRYILRFDWPSRRRHRNNGYPNYVNY